jgi:hypothetical protein
MVGGRHPAYLRRMTSERSRAYARVIKTLDEMGPAKLHDLEQRRVRNAADVLVFAGAQDYAALDALGDIEALKERLVDSGRWTPERAGRLADDVAACGPSWVDVAPLARAA